MRLSLRRVNHVRYWLEPVLDSSTAADVVELLRIGEEASLLVVIFERCSEAKDDEMRFAEPEVESEIHGTSA